MALDTDQIVLLRQHVRSVWTLEILLLMRSRPEVAWTPAALLQELRASSAVVSESLARLEQAGLILPADAGWRFAPAGQVLREFCDQLDRAYRERPVAIINLIARPTDPIQGLADAFRFKGDRE